MLAKTLVNYSEKPNYIGYFLYISNQIFNGYHFCWLPYQGLTKSFLERLRRMF